MKNENQSQDKKMQFLLAVVVVMAIGAGIYAGVNKSSTDLLIPALEVSETSRDDLSTLIEKAKQNPDEPVVYIGLANAYLQVIRETGDSAYYNDIDAVIQRAQYTSIEAGDLFALKANVALGRHDFAQALDFAKQAIESQPAVIAHLGLLADAQIELGLYEEAASTLQEMVDRRPDFSSFTRIAYMREITGDREGAIQAFERAILAGAPYNENRAWAHMELGKLLFATNPEKAKEQFLRAVDLYPDHTPSIQGLAKVAFLDGEKEESLQYLQQAFETLPLASYSADLAAYYKTTEDLDQFAFYSKASEASYLLAQSHGVDVDMEYALFLADYGGDITKAEMFARRAHKKRSSIVSADTLAWVLFKAGKLDESLALMDEVFETETTIPLILHHAHELYQFVNDEDKATQLDMQLQDLSIYEYVFFQTSFLD